MADEKRLIDANALLEAIKYEYDLNYGEILTDPCKFAEMVEDAPTVDAVEVVHGQWEPTAIIDVDWYTNVLAWRCTHCGWSAKDKSRKPRPPKFNYCPNCGARMDGDGLNGAAWQKGKNK